MLPLPPFCPVGGNGNTVTITGSTIWASYNTFDFSPAHCFPSVSPDLWYRFTATSNTITIDATGFNGLDTFFVKLYHSQGSCFSLVPLTCETSTLGQINENFLTPDIGEEYYIQVGGNEWYKTGDFTMDISSLNICNECVNESSIELTPAPWFGRYGISETVTMCYTVNRWDYLGSADLHGIVPDFGIDWDISTLAPVLAPLSHSSNNAWHWFTNVSTPDGPGDGYFYDPDNDGNPSNNRGDSAGVLDSWEACWKITTLPYCNVYDLGVIVNAYCDVQTGTGISAFACSPSTPLALNVSGWCCQQPTVSIVPPMSCNGTATITITGMGNTNDMFNFSVYDTGYALVTSVSNLATYSMALAPGEYNVEAYNINSGCIAYATLVIEPFMQMDLYQSFISCGSGFAELYAEPSGGTSPYTYNFLNHPLSQQNDSVAIQVPDGWMTVFVTDTAGCSVTDSIFVISLPAAVAYFEYPNQVYCTNEDTILVMTPPATFGGTYSLIYPLAAGITVDQNTGMIDLNNTAFATPFYLEVKYIVGAAACYDAFIDSVQIVSVPPAPIPTTPATASYCIGGALPSFTVSVPSNMFVLWYDAQTTDSAVTTTYTPALSAATTPGTYYYFATTFFTVTGGCTSQAIIFVVTANASPIITASNDITMCVSDTANLSVAGCPSCNYVWSPAPTFGSQFSSFAQTSPGSTTTYTIVATDPGTGCIGTDFTNVNINSSGNCGSFPPSSSTVTTYTGITPNGDGHNDGWVIDGIDSLYSARVAIYNRWGKEIWTSTGYNNSTVIWKGLDQNGNELPDGTYYYILLIGDFTKSGWIELSH